MLLRGPAHEGPAWCVAVRAGSIVFFGGRLGQSLRLSACNRSGDQTQNSEVPSSLFGRLSPKDFHIDREWVLDVKKTSEGRPIVNIYLWHLRGLSVYTRQKVPKGILSSVAESFVGADTDPKIGMPCRFADGKLRRVTG